MSGISGIIGTRLSDPNLTSHLPLMGRVLDRISSETNVDGSIGDDCLMVHLAWTRRQYEPQCTAWDERGDIGLVFMGDDFDLKAKTAMLPQPVASHTNPARRLIALYEKFGESFILALNGRFTGCLIDRRKETVTLFNDRYGLGRLYYHAADTSFYFSSEAKALLAVLPQLRRIDQRGLAEFYSMGCVLQNRTLFSGIELLPPASRWTFHRDGRIERNRYFEPAQWEQQEPLSAAEYTTRLTEVFSRILPKYLSGPEPVAMSLTGGLDSRMIMAWARPNPHTLPCYTFGGPYRDCADVRIARRLAQLCRQSHTTLMIESDFFRDFLQLAEKTIEVTDGAMDVSGAVELYMNRRARQIGPVRMTGNYGSEILRRYVAFRPSRLDTTLFTPEFRDLLDEAADTYRQEFACPQLTFIAFKQVPWHHFSRYAAERSQLSPRSPFLDHELVALSYRCPRNLAGSPRPLLELITSGNPDFDSVSTDRALYGHPSTASRLKRRWQELTAKAEYAYDYGMPRWLARTDAALRPLHLERLFLGRHKFYHFRVWYRDQLKSCLQSPEFRQQLPWYHTGVPARLIEEHTSGRVNRTLELHRLLSVQMIERSLASITSCRN